MADLICDFCSASEIVYLYPCKDFSIETRTPGAGVDYIGEWGACQGCHDVLQDASVQVYKKIEKLATRAILEEEKSTKEPRYILEKYRWMLEKPLDGFFENREGDPRRVEGS